MHSRFRVFDWFLLETSRNFTDSIMMGVKHFEVVKRRSHANKQWSPNKIRVWHSSSPWSGVSSLFLSSFSIPLSFIFQEAKESIDEEDPRLTSSNGAYIIGVNIKVGDNILSFQIWQKKYQLNWFSISLFIMFIIYESHKCIIENEGDFITKLMRWFDNLKHKVWSCYKW